MRVHLLGDWNSPSTPLDKLAQVTVHSAAEARVTECASTCRAAGTRRALRWRSERNRTRVHLLSHWNSPSTPLQNLAQVTVHSAAEARVSDCALRCRSSRHWLSTLLQKRAQLNARLLGEPLELAMHSAAEAGAAECAFTCRATGTRRALCCRSSRN